MKTIPLFSFVMILMISSSLVTATVLGGGDLAPPAPNPLTPSLAVGSAGFGLVMDRNGAVITPIAGNNFYVDLKVNPIAELDSFYLEFTLPEGLSFIDKAYFVAQPEVKVLSEFVSSRRITLGGLVNPAIAGNTVTTLGRFMIRADTAGSYSLQPTFSAMGDKDQVLVTTFRPRSVTVLAGAPPVPVPPAAGARDGTVQEPLRLALQNCPPTVQLQTPFTCNLMLLDTYEGRLPVSLKIAFSGLDANVAPANVNPVLSVAPELIQNLDEDGNVELESWLFSDGNEVGAQSYSLQG